MTGHSITLTAIGRVASSREQPDDDDWDPVKATIHLDSGQVHPDSTAGLDGFTHIEVIYRFHAADCTKTERGSRHPRDRADWPRVGILAQRAKDRPNHLGVTICRLVAVNGLDLEVTGLDAIDGSPVLDVKPVMAEFLPRGELRQPSWSSELMRDYWRRARGC